MAEMGQFKMAADPVECCAYRTADGILGNGTTNGDFDRTTNRTYPGEVLGF
jgi:hypothetical protein